MNIHDKNIKCEGGKEMNNIDVTVVYKDSKYKDSKLAEEAEASIREALSAFNVNDHKISVIMNVDIHYFDKDCDPAIYMDIEPLDDYSKAICLLARLVREDGVDDHDVEIVDEASEL